MEMGIIQRWGRGFYCLNDKSLPYEPEMLMVARRYPAAVICLVSALSFHDMTTQIPHAVDIAIPYQGNAPRSSYPLVHTFRFRDAIYEAGIETHDMQGVPLKVYNMERLWWTCSVSGTGSEWMCFWKPSKCTRIIIPSIFPSFMNMPLFAELPERSCLIWKHSYEQGTSRQQGRFNKRQALQPVSEKRTEFPGNRSVLCDGEIPVPSGTI